MNKFLGLLPSRVSFTCVTSARFEMPLAIYFRLLRITRSAMGANFWWIMKQNLSCFDLKEKSWRREGKWKINISLASAEIIREFARNSWARGYISKARCELWVPQLDEEEKITNIFVGWRGNSGVTSEALVHVPAAANAVNVKGLPSKSLFSRTHRTKFVCVADVGPMTPA